jgi:DNA primase
MAKTYLNTIKYEIQAKYEVDGIVEKPDVVGAIFGQSEGLLGEDMDLKELQQAGKIGRIEITGTKQKGKTSGEITIPSSLDQVKTSILAATIETVEKVGPCNTVVKVLKIIDTRKEKRDVITDRAKQLLTRMQKFEGIETAEIADSIKNQMRTSKIIDLNGLPAGPEAQSSKEIIIVEGRADVLKLLSHGIKNVIAMNGSNIEKSLIDLCKHKTTTILIDGDRGGELNAKKLSALTNVNFVARAPDGKEVEELTQKEILQALKRKHTIVDYLKEKNNYQKQPYQSNYKSNNYREQNNNYRNQNNNYQNNNYRNQTSYNSQTNNERNDRRSYGDWRNNKTERTFDPFKGNYRPKPQITTKEPAITKIETQNKNPPITKEPIKTIEVNKTIQKDYAKIKGKLKARFYDDKNKKIKDISVKEIIPTMEKSKKKVNTILFDGIITKRLIEASENHGVKTLIGARKSAAKTDKINLQTM